MSRCRYSRSPHLSANRNYVGVQCAHLFPHRRRMIGGNGPSPGEIVKTPRSVAAARNVPVESITRELTRVTGSPSLKTVKCCPRSSLLYTPAFSVVTYTILLSEGSTMTSVSNAVGNPLRSNSHVKPPSLLRRKPDCVAA